MMRHQGEIPLFSRFCVNKQSVHLYEPSLHVMMHTIQPYEAVHLISQTEQCAIFIRQGCAYLYQQTMRYRVDEHHSYDCLKHGQPEAIVADEPTTIICFAQQPLQLTITERIDRSYNAQRTIRPFILEEEGHHLHLGLQVDQPSLELMVNELESHYVWALAPAQDGNNVKAEGIVVLTGALLVEWDGGERLLSSGEAMMFHPIAQFFRFQAYDDCKFLYFAAGKVFHKFTKAHQQLFKLAVAVEEKDSYTAGHCLRLKYLSALVAKQLNLPIRQRLLLDYAAFLHDIGKVKIPDEVLLKPSRLTDEEYEVMKRHTIYGQQMLLETEIHTLHEVAHIVSQHHERIDGRGYPFGMSGDDIRIEAKIIAVVDSYDAMTTERVYATARPKTEALAELERCRGTMYDPHVVEAFLAIAPQL